jgi:hypothetical protein
MKTLIANMKHAARNHESVHIGGGLFSPEELLAATKQFEALETAALAALEELKRNPCEAAALLRQALRRIDEK